MGFFSWKTQDTNRSIPNRYCGREQFKVVMHDNIGNIWIEERYEGYGVFGGKDYYELLDEMNGGSGDRLKGIEKAFAGYAGCLYPNLTESEEWDWINQEAIRCEYQGYFYDDNEDDIDDL